jgi:S-DNA-T family DNA segregation ATPase FtsK/SpoIIIE
MAGRAASMGGRTLLPEGARLFFKRRLSEAGGFALAGSAGLFALALLSHDPADPSSNHAVDGPVRNLLGPTGATLSDALLQTIGVAAVLPAIVLLGWAFRLLANRGVTRVTLRTLIVLPAMPVAAAALAIIPVGASWRLRTGLGGWVGDGLLGGLMKFGLPAVPAAMACAALFGLALVYAIGLSWRDWRDIGEGASRMATASTRRAAGLAGIGATLRERLMGFMPRRRAEPATEERPRAEPRLERPRREPTPPAAPEPPAPPPPKRRALPPDLVTKPAAGPKRPPPSRQASLDLEPADEAPLPPIDLLTEPPKNRVASVNEDALEQNARLLETVLDDFGVKGEIVKVRPGPVVTLYELEPAPGIKASRIIGLADDIARSMSAVSVRVAVVPGRTVMGIELPNAKAETVYLRELMDSEAYADSSAKLPLVLGKDIGGGPVIADLAKMPHLLIAGTTGSGKSVGINTMILSILYRMRPDACKFIMIDPKMLELSIYDGIPHLLAPVVTDPRKAIVALKWTVREMETRYRNMSKLGVRNVEGYNARLLEAASRGESLTRRVQTGFDPDTGQPVFEDQPLDMTPLPFIVVVVDEMADLMLVAGKDIEAAIQRLAQMARAAGIHIIMATQRPSVDVITGTIKANFPTRVSFQVTSKIDSRTILGEGGAEQLLGRGDMLYMAGGGRITRVHGPFVADQEVEAVVKFLKENGEPSYLDEVTEGDDGEGGGGGGFSLGGGSGGGDEDGDGNSLYDQAVAVVCRERKASTSFIQRHLQIGYNRAARLIERMEQEGVVSQANHVGKREVLAPRGPE